MPSEYMLFSFAVALLTTAILLYGSYWAFAIGRVRTSNLYRKQATSVGVVGVYFGILWVASPFTDQLVPKNLVSLAISAIAFFVGGILIFSWIDRSMRVARRSDPVRRDTFRWTRTRLVIWGLIVFDVIILAGLYPRESLGQNLTLVENIPFFALFLAIFAFASPALFVAARRSKDPTLHRNLRWFALFIVFVLGYTEAGYLNYITGQQNTTGGGYLVFFNIIGVIVTLVPVAGAYSLYRSAKSLAPLQSVPAASVEKQHL
jgi:drug/metabolite transporter (DMT)-like permease